MIGQAANFYNSDEYIGIENDFALDDFSIAFYGRIDEVNSDYNFFFQARTSDKDNVLGFAYDHGFLHAQYSYSGLIGDSQYDYEYDLLASGWTHFVLQTSGDSNIDIYLNGSKVTSFDITKTDILLEYITLAQEQDCLRGCFESDQRLIGSLDDFRIYNRALNSEEIQALYELGQVNVNLSYGLLAHYEFEGDADDSSGNGNDGEEFGGVSYTDGVIGQAANFYNSDEYIGIENDFALDDFSIAFYGKIDEVNSDYNFFFQARTSDKDNVLGFAYDHGFLHAQYSYSGLIGDSQYDYEYDLLASGWTHFVLQTNGDSNIDIYLNGSKVTSFDITKTDILLEYITLAQEQDCLRGCFESDQRLIGSLDDFRIYNRALNSEEIQALYELGQVNVNLSYGLLAHYEFEGDADDSSGNGNDGEEFGGVSYTDGVIGQAANFYNSDEYIGIENDFALDDFSIAFYGKIDEVNSDYNFFFQARTSDKDNVLGFAYDHGFLHAQYSYSGLIGDSQYDYEYDLLASGWTHFVLQTSGDSNIDIYLNGSKVTSFDITKTDILLEYITLAQEQDCLRGCFESDQRLIGSLDDFRIYNRALNSEEIQALYELGK